MQESRDGKQGGEFQKAETELEKLIREVKELERQEAKEKMQGASKKVGDHITSHFDMSTVRLKAKGMKVRSALLSEVLLKNIFSSFGIIDGVLLDEADGKAYVMFRFRDHALKAVRELSEDH